MFARVRRMQEEANDLVREQRLRKKVEEKAAWKRGMPDWELAYYVEEARKYGSLPEGLTEYQARQVRLAMEVKG